VPFVLYNIPSLDEATRKWSTPSYLSKGFGKKMLDAETCNTSHFQVRGFMRFPSPSSGSSLLSVRLSNPM
jgi:hypothetical protein